MVEKAEEREELKPGYTIIEATSGNTGVSFAMISAIKGYKFIAVMSENVGKGKRKLMKILGAKLILTPEKEGYPRTIKKTAELAKKYKKVWLPKQFENPDNIEAHRRGLGQEILREINKVDAFVAGIGTGGTLMGVAKALRTKSSKVKIIGVEAAESPHKIEGISDFSDKTEIIPKIVDFSLIDGIIKIKSEEAISMAKKLAKKYGLLVGISSGANFFAALKVKKRLGKNKNIVTILPDRAERYPELW